MPAHKIDPHQQLDALREQLQHASAAVAEAKRDVESDLLAGKPTAPARERLSACIQRHREIETLIEAIQARIDRDQADAADRRASELCELIDARLVEFLDKFPVATLPETAQ